jgi:hypothetical protein
VQQFAIGGLAFVKATKAKKFIRGVLLLVVEGKGKVDGVDAKCVQEEGADRNAAA